MKNTLDSEKPAVWKKTQTNKVSKSKTQKRGDASTSFDFTFSSTTFFILVEELIFNHKISHMGFFALIPQSSNCTFYLTRHTLFS